MLVHCSAMKHTPNVTGAVLSGVCKVTSPHLVCSPLRPQRRPLLLNCPSPPVHGGRWGAGRERPRAW